MKEINGDWYDNVFLSPPDDYYDDEDEEDDDYYDEPDKDDYDDYQAAERACREYEAWVMREPKGI